MSDNKDTEERGNAQTQGASTIDQSPAEGRDPGPTPKPSQAEGDRETVDEDLRTRENAARWSE